MLNKNTINEYIMNFIQENNVSDQLDIQSFLKDSKFDISQATLSRRLKELKIFKINGFYKVADFANDKLPVVLDIKISDFGLIVLHTNPGAASSLAYFLDKKYIKLKDSNQDILGTIAGDDTIVVISKNAESLKNILILFKKDFPYLNIN